jgi:SAM-dependent methyltransferase
MSDATWSDVHKNYQTQDWIDKPSIFAETAIQYFPKAGKILELGAGQGQDGRFFAEHGYSVVCTDLEDTALGLANEKLPEDLQEKVSLQKLDLREALPFEAASFDMVYAHLSLHYFELESTARLLDQITRVLKPGGVLAFLVNSTSDPEYASGKQLEPDFFQVDKVTKRYFSVVSTRELISDFYEINLLDNLGETYKDANKGVHNLIRFIGLKPTAVVNKYALPCVGAILERVQHGVKEVYVQTRWKPGGDPKYSGTLEFPIGRLDTLYENVFDVLAHEINSESGLTLKTVRNDSRTEVVSPQGDDAAFGFRPFCCVQQLRNGKPWVGFIFICEVEPGVEPKPQLSESKDPRWMPASEFRELLQTSPEKIFALELPAWQYYFESERKD